MSAVKALQQWCRVQCDGYRDVAITNMTTSFRDGLAFCALIHKHRPDLIKFDSLNKENVYENNKLAFQVAEQELGIPALLDAEDMVALRVPDRLSILTYVSQYYNYFHGRSPIGGMGGIKRPAEAPTDEPSGKKNQAVTAKVFPPSKPARENTPPTRPNPPGPSPGLRQSKTGTQEVVEKSPPSGTLSNMCVVCNKHVHLVQRHLVEGKLYHRNCAKIQSSTNTTSPLRPLPTNTSVSKFTPPPSDTRKTTTTAPNPFRPAPASQPEKLGTSSIFSSTFSGTTPSRPATGLSPTAKGGQTALVFKPASSQTTSGGTFTTSTPTFSTASTQPAATPRTSATAEKTQQAKLKFLQGETTNKEEKKTTTITLDVNKGSKVPVKVQENKAGQAQTVVVNIGGAGKKETGPKAAAVGGGGKVTTKQDDKEAKTKASAAAFISKKLEENNNNNNKPSWANVALKKTDKAQRQDETPKRDPGPAKGRVKLKVDPSILADLQPSDNPTSAAGTQPPFKTPDRGGFKPGSPAANATGAADKETPADWRSKLKPVAKETKPVGPSQSPNPGVGKPQAVVSPPVSKGLQNGQKDKAANGTKSSVSKTKPDYIPKEEILKELQEIEDNLNELEKRGVELEVKLRQSEEEGEDDDELMVEWFSLIRNKQLAMRRESELVYIDRTQELEQEQPSVEQELRKLMEKPERLKTALDRKREAELMSKLIEIVEDRNTIVENLDEDRLREEEEDQQLDQMMKDFNIKKEKPKKKSPMAKLFSWGNKKEG